MGVRFHRMALLLTAFAAVGVVAFGEGAAFSQPAQSASASDSLPKHPIPYKALKKRAAKPKVKAKAKPAATAQKTNSAANPMPPAPPPAAGLGAKPVPLRPAGPRPNQAPPRPAPKSSAPFTAPLLAVAPKPSNAAPAPGLAAPIVAPAVAPPPPHVAPPPKPATPAPALAIPPPPLPAPQTGARLQTGQAMPASELEAFVDGEVSHALANDHIAGVAVAVVQNGQLVMEKGYGASSPAHARIDPRTTLVRLGSASQIFTWIAALKAIEDGKLNLDAPVNAYLPEALKLPDEGFDRPILLRHLMSHTAGFEDRALGRRYVRNADRLAPLDQALERFRPRRVRAAGLLSIPSDYGVALAGDIVARAEGHPFDQLIESEILKPLALAHTTFREPYPPAAGLPDPMSPTLASGVGGGFRWTGHGFEPQPFAYGQSLAPALSASTTADDMARLMIALLDNGKMGEASIYGAKAAALLRSPLQQSEPGLDGWAHGLAMQRSPGGFEMLSEAGHAPGFTSGLYLIPALNFGVFIVANTDTGGPLSHQLAGAIVQRFYASPPVPPAPSAAPDIDYTGAFLSAKRAYHGLEAFTDRLTKQSTIVPDQQGGLTLSNASGARVFEPTDMAGRFRSADGVELSTTAVNGKVRAYALGSGGGAAERVGGLHSVWALKFWAAVTMLAVFASFAGLFIRDRIDLRASRAQTIARVTQLLACVIWCVAFASFWLFAGHGLSSPDLAFDWPNRWLIAASWAALAAGILSLIMVTQLPGAWREERRIHGWSIWRKLRHTGTVCVFLVFTGVLAAWGALEPWSS